MSSVGLFKDHYVKIKKSKVIGRTPKGYTSPIWGEAPINPVVTKCGLWVPFPDRISRAKFHCYCTNIFLCSGMQKIRCPHWLEVTFTTARTIELCCDMSNEKLNLLCFQNQQLLPLRIMSLLFICPNRMELTQTWPAFCWLLTYLNLSSRVHCFLLLTAAWNSTVQSYPALLIHSLFATWVLYESDIVFYCIVFIHHSCSVISRWLLMCRFKAPMTAVLEASFPCQVLVILRTILWSILPANSVVVHQSSTGAVCNMVLASVKYVMYLM